MSVTYFKLENILKILELIKKFLVGNWFEKLLSENGEIIGTLDEKIGVAKLV